MLTETKFELKNHLRFESFKKEIIYVDLKQKFMMFVMKNCISQRLYKWCFSPNQKGQPIGRCSTQVVSAAIQSRHKRGGTHKRLRADELV